MAKFCKAFIFAVFFGCSIAILTLGYGAVMVALYYAGKFALGM